MDKQELKPCPFCGGEADSEILSGFETVFHDSSCAGTGDCPIEGLRGWDADVWNNRPIEDALHAKIAQLSRMVDESEVAEMAFLKNIQRLTAENERLRVQIVELEGSVKFLRAQISAPKNDNPF